MNEANELPPGTASLLEELESIYLISVYVLFYLVLPPFFVFSYYNYFFSIVLHVLYNYSYFFCKICKLIYIKIKIT